MRPGSEAFYTPLSVTSRKSFPFGYTLVEVVVCVALIAVLSTVAMTSMRNTDSAKAAAAARFAFQINNAAMIYKQETGDFPQEEAESVLPKELHEYFREDIFEGETPIGGKWDWNGEGGQHKFPGISINYENTKNFQLSLAKLVDSLVDDGNFNSGRCFLNISGDVVSLHFSLTESLE